MSELTQDYPVQGHNRLSKTGLRHSVKSHERNVKGKLQKEIILLKVEKLKKERELILSEDEWAEIHIGSDKPHISYKEYLERERKRLGLDFAEILTPVVSRVDYPVQGHTRGGKPVKAHTRGEGKKERDHFAIIEGKKTFIPYRSELDVLNRSKLSYKGTGVNLQIRLAGFDPNIWVENPIDKFLEKGISPNLVRAWEKKLDQLNIRYKPKGDYFFKSEIEKNEAEKWLYWYRHIGIKKKIENITWKELEEKYGKSHFIKEKFDFIITPVIKSFIKRTDSIPFSEFIQLKTDFPNSDFVIFHGAIARDGPYDYMDENGNVKTLYKDIDNLRDIYSRYNYLPMKTSEIPGAHIAEEFGYATNFSVNEKTNEIEADLVLVNDDNFKEILSKKELYHVSPGYNDIVTGNIQMLTDVDHVALALGEEIGRACTGTNSKGASCTKVIKIHDQNLIEVVSN